MAAASTSKGGKLKVAETTAQAALWKDSCHRELKAFEKHSRGSEARPFHVNPHTLSLVTSKIGSPPPAVTDELLANRRELEKTVARASLIPQQKFKAPATTAHEYGWYAAEATPEPFSSALRRSDEVKFATAYARSFHVGPFGKTQPMAR
jgi:hypothetical protein